MAKPFNFDELIKSGVEQAMEECELTIGMTLKEAVEKQIPMKAVTHGERNRKINSISYTCPVCKSHINRSNYCSSCGQAIVFETENENDVI